LNPDIVIKANINVPTKMEQKNNMIGSWVSVSGKSRMNEIRLPTAPTPIAA
jgi:hypothetical protein